MVIGAMDCHYPKGTNRHCIPRSKSNGRLENHESLAETFAKEHFVPILEHDHMCYGPYAPREALGHDEYRLRSRLLPEASLRIQLCLQIACDMTHPITLHALD